MTKCPQLGSDQIRTKLTIIHQFAIIRNEKNFFLKSLLNHRKEASRTAYGTVAIAIAIYRLFAYYINVGILLTLCLISHFSKMNSFHNTQFWLKIDELKQKIASLTNELEHERKDKEAMKSQSTNLEKEYDRLSEEYSKLERRLTVTGQAHKDE